MLILIYTSVLQSFIHTLSTCQHCCVFSCSLVCSLSQLSLLQPGCYLNMFALPVQIMNILNNPIMYWTVHLCVSLKVDTRAQQSNHETSCSTCSVICSVVLFAVGFCLVKLDGFMSQKPHSSKCTRHLLCSTFEKLNGGL